MRVREQMLGKIFGLVGFVQPGQRRATKTRELPAGNRPTLDHDVEEMTTHEPVTRVAQLQIHRAGGALRLTLTHCELLIFQAAAEVTPHSVRMQAGQRPARLKVRITRRGTLQAREIRHQRVWRCNRIDLTRRKVDKDRVTLARVGQLAGRVSRQVGGPAQRTDGIRQTVRTCNGRFRSGLVQHCPIDHPNGHALELQRVGRPGGGRLNRLCAALLWRQ